MGYFLWAAPLLKHQGFREENEARIVTIPATKHDLDEIPTANSRHSCAFLRKVAARTVPGLNRAIRSFIPQLSPQECANYFRHAGYASI
jgi:hypothetical protein